MGSSPFAFLFPHVPLVPDVPLDALDARRSIAHDAELFPSDEQLNQRTLWTMLLVVFGWSILGLASALPLYLVSMPCVAQTGPQATFNGVYSTLQDLSLMRLLLLFDEEGIPTTNLLQYPHNARARVIALTVLALVFGLLPASWKVLREFNTMVAYRKSFINMRCEGQELGWLTASRAPGFVGWGERRMKDFLLRTGLSYSMEARDSRDDSQTRSDRRRARRSEEQHLNHQEEANLEVDIQSLFSIGSVLSFVRH